MTDFNDLVGQVEGQEPFRLPVRVLLDSDAHARLQQLEGQLERSLNRPDDDDVTVAGPSAVAADIAAILEAHKPAEFVFEAVAATAWDRLVAAHPGDTSDVALSFWPAVMAECCVSPAGATVEGFAKLVGDETTESKLNSGQRETLVQAVREVNRGLTDLRPSYAATALIRGTRHKSTIADREESLEADGLDG